MSSNGVTDEMVEAGARAIFDSKLIGAHYREAEPWEGRGTVTKAFCREAARACLTAALGESYVVVPGCRNAK